MGVASRLKFRIGRVVDEHVRGQTQTRLGDNGFRVVVEPVLEQFVRLDPRGSRRRFGAVGLRLLEKRGDVRGRDRVAAEAGLEAVQPEGCQHQQPRDERNEQPSHTAK